MTATLLGLLELQAELITDALVDDARALCNLSACCRDTRRLVGGSDVWKKLCVQHRVFLPGACEVGRNVVTNDTVIARMAPLDLHLSPRA